MRCHKEDNNIKENTRNRGDEQKRVDAALAIVVGEVAKLGIECSKNIENEVTINRRARSRFGCCRKQRRFGMTRYQIEVSEAMLTAPEKNLKQTLAHEVLHTCKGCYNHSERWQSYAQKMNETYGYDISRTSTATKLGITDERFLEKERKRLETSKEQRVEEAKYLIVCEKCGTQIPRQRMSSLVKRPYLYRCKCGGTLTRVR